MRIAPHTTYALALALFALIGPPIGTRSADAVTSPGSGGAGVPPPPAGGDAPDRERPRTTSHPTAQLAADGRTAIPPASAPAEVKAAIYAANRITRKPYRYGGGHRRWNDRGYDCSGAVSFALNGAGLLRRPLASGPLMRWGQRGPGRWVTVYTSRGHAYVVIAGLRFDTSGPGERGPRWRKQRRSTRGYVVRHPRGL